MVQVDRIQLHTNSIIEYNADNIIQYNGARVTANKWMVCNYVPITLYDMIVRANIYKRMNGIQPHQ